MEEEQDQFDASSEDNVKGLIESEAKDEIELKQIYLIKEKELQSQYSVLRELIQKRCDYIEDEYNQDIIMDPFLMNYSKELEDEINDIDWDEKLKQKNSNLTVDQLKDKQQQLKKLQEIWQISEGPLEFLKVLSDLQVSYRSLMEELHIQIFKGQQEREQLEESQGQFQQKLKELREQIKNIAEQNRKLLKEIENLKPQM